MLRSRSQQSEILEKSESEILERSESELIWSYVILLVPTAQQLISSSNANNRSAALWVGHRWYAEWLENTTRLHLFIPNVSANLPGMTLLRTAWVWFNRLHTSVGRVCSCLHKWGMAPSEACECRAEEQTADHTALHCPNHQPPHGTHGLTFLDETIKWLLNICPEIYCGLAVSWKNLLKR